MIFTTAEKLKEAGFQMSCQHENDGEHKTGRIYTQDVCSYSTTIPELLKALGDSFRRISKDGGMWISLGWNKDLKDIASAESEPDESLAQLWLKINTK
jgi:hypothetical protein